VRSGWHRVRASQIGYQATARDSVLVQAGAAVTVDFALQPQAVAVSPVTVQARPDVVLDPLATATTQRLSAAELRRLPVSSVDAMAGGDRVRGRVGYGTEGPAADGWDYGPDRVVAQADGPWGGHSGLVAVADAAGQVGAVPGSAPAPADARASGTARRWLLGH